MSFQQSSNEPPYQQQPPVMSPRPSGSVDFQAVLKAQENRPLVIAGAGAILTLIGYFTFPIWGYSFKGISGIPGTSSSASATLSDVGKYANGLYGLTWLVLIASLVATAVVAAMLFFARSVPQLTPRMAAITLTVCGAICVLWTVIDWLKFNSYGGSSLGLGADSGISAGTQWGMYLVIITSIALLVGGVMQLRRTPAI